MVDVDGVSTGTLFPVFGTDLYFNSHCEMSSAEVSAEAGPSKRKVHTQVVVSAFGN